MNSLESEVLNHLKPLIGLRLSIARRAADMRNFQFGEIRKVENGTVGEYAIHIQCPWRIEGPSGVITGRSDLWQPVEIGERFDWNEWDYEKGENLQDRMIGELLKGYDVETRSHINGTGILVVEDVKADQFGGAELHLSGGYRIVLFPDGAQGEQWRIFCPRSEGEHFVVTGPGETD